MDVGALLKESYDFLRKNPVLLLPLVLIFVLNFIVAVASIPYIEGIILVMTRSLLAAGSPTSMIFDLLVFMFPLLIASIVISLLAVIFHTTITSSIKKGMSEKITAKDTFANFTKYGVRSLIAQIAASIKFFWPLLLALLLLFLIPFTTFALYFALFFGLLFVAWTFYWFMRISRKLALIHIVVWIISFLLILLSMTVAPVFMAIALLPLFLGFITLLIWCVLILISICYIVPCAIVFEDAKIIESINLSFDFIRRNRIDTAILSLILIVLGIAVSMPSIIGSQFAVSYAYGSSIIPQLSVNAVALMLVQAWDFVVSVLFGAYSLIAFVLLYSKLRPNAKPKKTKA